MTAKTLDAGIGDHIDSGSTALAWALEVVRSDTTALRYCTGTQPATIDGDDFTPVSGATFSSIANTLGMDVDNLLVTLGDSDDILREDVLDQVWDGARYRIFQFNQLDPSDGVIPWQNGFVADIEPRVGAFDAELRDLRQAMHQDNTRTFQFACPYELGDAKCRQDLAAFTVTGVEVTAVASNQEFTTDLAQAAGWATEGRLLVTTGNSANGIWRKIALHAGTSGAAVFTLDRAAIKGIEVGDLLTVIAGCDHTPPTCIDKFDNMVNYGGCPTKPPTNDIFRGRREDE